MNLKLAPIGEKHSRIRFKLPYTFGIHKGEIGVANGQLDIDSNPPHFISSADFSIPISSLSTGNEMRDCHLREAMGIKYSTSKYPEKHVCDRENKLPKNGPDSILYPTVHFKLESLKLDPLDADLSGLNTSITAKAEGKWSMHGITRPVRLPLTIQREEEDYRVEGKFNFSLKEYEIVVKKVKFLFIPVGVKDRATVNFDLLFRPNGGIK